MAAAATAAVDEVENRDTEPLSAVEGGSSGNASGTVREVPREVMQNRVYFRNTMYAYIGGLLLAFGANAVTHAGQPALLYLCPATLLAVYLTADGRGELERVWDYKDLTRSPTDVMKEAEAKAKTKAKARDKGKAKAKRDEEKERKSW